MLFETKTKKLNLLLQEWSGCKRCPLHEERKNIVFGSGPVDADIMLIGEGPGKDEDETGLPFVGRAGHMLSHLLNLAKLDRSKLNITNIVACRPTVEVEAQDGKMKKKDRTPNKVEATACWHWIEQLIYLVDPIVIVAAGKQSGLRLTGARTLKDAMKDILSTTIQGINGPVVYPVMTIYHPSYLMRKAHNQDLFQLTVDQLKHLKSTMEIYRALGRDRPWKEAV